MFNKQSNHWKKTTLFCYALIILMMAILAFFNHQGFHNLIEKESLSQHSHKIISSGKEILLALENAETSQRGYIITGDSTYLNSYATSLDSALFHLLGLKTLTLDSPNQQAQIKVLEGLINTKVELLNTTLLWKNQGEGSKLEQYFATRRGKRRMENLMGKLDEIVKTEERLLTQRNEELIDSFLWMKGALHAIILITIFISILLYFLYRQQFNLKKAFENELLEQNNKLLEANQQLQVSGDKVKARNEQLLAMNQELITSKGRLTELNESLEDRVAQRTQQLSKANRKNLELLEKEKLSRMHLEFVTNFIPEIVWQTQPDGNHDFFNDRWYEYTGRTAEDSLQQAWTSALHADDYQKSLKNWKYALSHGTPYTAECRLRKADGTYRWFISRALPFKNKDGKIIRWIGTCADVHDFKVQEQSLESHNRRLTEINQYMDNFVHATAHDLRSPVANMQGLLQLLNNSQEIDENKRKILMELLHQSVNRLDNTLKSLIKLIEQQSYEASPKEKVALNEIWESVLRENQHLLDKTSYIINTNFNFCKEATVVKPYLESIFRNLLSNSLKYKKDDEELILNVSCRKQGDFVVMKFEDNGIGIDMEKFGKNIFKPFARFTNQATGSGIGLHMISNMLQRMDGRIEVDSSPGKCTTFTIYFKEETEEDKKMAYIKRAG